MTPKKKDNTLKEDDKTDSSGSNIVNIVSDEQPDDAEDNKNDEKKETNPESKEPTRPIIPGLPEEDRLKLKKSRKKKGGKKKKDEQRDDSKSMVKEDFLISPSSGALKEKITNTEWVFSDYDDEESDTDGSNDEFEDSREVQSEADNPPAEQSDFLTPVNLKSTFARNLQAKTTVTPILTPTCSIKRAAKSPAAKKELKKSRGQSKLPKKK